MFNIFYEVLLPIFLLIGLGVLLDKKFKLDLQTLSKINFYGFVPALVFVKLQQSTLSGDRILELAMAALVHLLVLALLVAPFLFLARKKIQATIPMMGVVFYNAGNFGIPLVALFFGEEAVAYIAVILMVQNLGHFSLGILVLNRKSGKNFFTELLSLLKVPVLWAILLAFVLPEVGGPLGEAAGYLADGLIPAALLTLGAQLGRCQFKKDLIPALSISFVRLFISPLVMLAVIALWPSLSTDLHPYLIAAAGFPVAVNVYLLALEYKKDEELAAQLVFWTTVGTVLSMSLWLWVIEQWYMVVE